MKKSELFDKEILQNKIYDETMIDDCFEEFRGTDSYLEI